MSFLDHTLSQFTSELSSRSSVPSGGGATALVGAIGAALGNMVGELTVGKEKYADVEEDMKLAMLRAQELTEELLTYIDRDAEGFIPLAKAYSIPKDDPRRDEIMESCLKEAALAPMQILKLCCRTIDLLQEIGEKGAAIALSDVATGVVCSRAAMMGAAINVKVNTKLMKDRTYAEAVNAEADRLTAEYSPLADRIYMDVCGRFC